MLIQSNKNILMMIVMKGACPRKVSGGLIAFLISVLPVHAAPLAPVLFSEMGSHKRKVTTESKEAQKWFDQGLNWYFAFNFDEAQIAFRRATEIDPSCAMAWWGLSEAAGPQYNHPVMDESRTEVARKAMSEARKHLEHITPVERALVEALSHRNLLDEPNDKRQSRQNELYAEAMAKLWEAFPRDADVGVLYANARMTIRPWQLYETKTRVPLGDTLEIQSIVEQVLTIAPQHPGALHLYIHLLEPSKNPGLALSVANRLSKLVPASGHMLHMPTHIYIQTGEWDRGVGQNAKAMGADVAYRARAPGRTTQIGYQIHNAHMLAFAAMMSARRNEAMAAARAMWEMWEEAQDGTPEGDLAGLASYVDTVMGAVYDVHKRFGDWDAILEEGEPLRLEMLPITRAVRHSARAVAFANKKEFEKAEAELEQFRALAKAFDQEHAFGTTKAHLVLAVGGHFVEGELALNLGDWQAAAKSLEAAIESEDALAYVEPPQYLQPSRHALGAVYLAADKPGQAERIYREDLKKWPDNVWSLYGLKSALEQQEKLDMAKRTEKRLEKVMEFSDFEVESSCMCLCRP